MSMEPSKATGNGIVATPSVTSTPKPHLTNGYTDKSYTSLSNDLLFPPGGIPSLRLPVVVVLMPYLFSIYVHIGRYSLCFISKRSNG
jgi:serine/threonine-protein phosphatase 2A regulatory subunit B